METNAQMFDRIGDRWDTRKDTRHALVQALRELVDRTDREFKAEGYNGKLKPVRHGRDFRAPVVPKAPKPLNLIYREFANGLSHVDGHGKLPERPHAIVPAPPSLEREEIVKSAEDGAREHAAWIERERQKLVECANRRRR